MLPKPGSLRKQTHQWLLWTGTFLGLWEPLSHTWYPLESVWMCGDFFQVIRTLKESYNISLGLYKITEFLSLLWTLILLYISHTNPNWEKSMGSHLKSSVSICFKKGGKTKLSSNTTTSHGLSVEQVLKTERQKGKMI